MNVNEKLDRLDELIQAQDLAGADRELSAWADEAIREGDRGAALTFYNEMEGLYRVTGRAAEAAAISEKALALIEDMGLQGTVHHATTLLNGATANRVAGNIGKAKELYLAAAGIYEGMEESQDRTYYLATLNNNLAQVYQEEKDYGQARVHLLKALELIRQCPGCEGEEATTLVNLSLLYMMTGEQKEADSAIAKALSYYEGSEGEKDNHSAAAFTAAGELAYWEGDNEKARAYLKKALAISEAVFGETPETISIRRKLAKAEGE